MRRIAIGAMKVNIVFREDQLPALDPNHPEFILSLGPFEVRARVNVKTARKLATHQGGAVLQGRLIVERGKLVLDQAGFNWIDPKPAAEPAAGGGSGA
jgi:hypothetical protein